MWSAGVLSHPYPKFFLLKAPPRRLYRAGIDWGIRMSGYVSEMGNQPLQDTQSLGQNLRPAMPIASSAPKSHEHCDQNVSLEDR